MAATESVWSWLDTFSRFNFRIKHVPGPLNVPPDALSRRLDLPEPTNSEFQAGAEFKPQYLLDLALPKAQEWEAGTRLTW